ncbi:MAG: insulinase family protein, partial [Sphingomonadales bacterium]
SRIYGQLNERGLAVKSYGYSMEMEARGLVAIEADPAPGVSVGEVQDVVARVMRRFLRDGPTEDELVRAKESIAASSIFTRDNQMAMARWYGELLTAGQSVERIESWDERIRAVTAADVKRVMNFYLGARHVDAVLLPESK